MTIDVTALNKMSDTYSLANIDEGATIREGLSTSVNLAGVLEGPPSGTHLSVPATGATEASLIATTLTYTGQLLRWEQQLLHRHGELTGGAIAGIVFAVLALLGILGFGAQAVGIL